MPTATERGIRSVQRGIAANIALAILKLAAGLIGNTYALVADAVESGADVVSSLIVWGGLSIASQPADEDHPYGHGKAEALAGAAVSGLLFLAAVGIALEAIHKIETPHKPPKAWTLIVLVSVMLTKVIMARRVKEVGESIGSTAVQADALHHWSDVVTSAAAFVGISVAIAGTHYIGGTLWATADDWAAIAATLVIAYNAMHMLMPSIHDLMDRSPGLAVIDPVRAAAVMVPGVCAVEHLTIRKTGLQYHVDLHVQADPRLSLEDAHVLSGQVKHSIRHAVPQVQAVLVHMEPFHPQSTATAAALY